MRFLELSERHLIRLLVSSRAFSSAWGRLGNEAFIFGQVAFDWATPARLRDHLPWFTALALMVRLS